jgi:hypothetical protein
VGRLAGDARLLVPYVLVINPDAIDPDAVIRPQDV